jgi:RpiR family carbohydrate utilization transcriptional regulator
MADVLSTIRNSLDRLKNAERRVAECVLSNPLEVFKYTITELAEEAKTSEPTVVRFCRKIGLNGYIELRLNLAHDLPPSPYIHEPVDTDDTPLQIIEKIMNTNIEALRNLMSSLDNQSFDAVVEVLGDAQRIEFYGVGGSGIVAQDAYHKFFRLGISCIALADPHIQVMSASLLKRGDVAVVISGSGSTKDSVETARTAQEAGASVIGISGRIKSPLNKFCDYYLAVDTQEAAVWLAPICLRIAQVALMDALFVSVAIRKYAQTKEKLERVKRSLVNKLY